LRSELLQPEDQSINDQDNKNSIGNCAVAGRSPTVDMLSHCLVLNIFLLVDGVPVENRSNNEGVTYL
jgi:hypothetical protein